jgi:hypothetical protein
MHNLKSIKKNTNTLINLGSHTNTIREKNLKQYVLLQKLKLKNSKRIKICRKKINKISFYKKQQTSLKKYIKK